MHLVVVLVEQSSSSLVVAFLEAAGSSSSSSKEEAGEVASFPLAAAELSVSKQTSISMMKNTKL